MHLKQGLIFMVVKVITTTCIIRLVCLVLGYYKGISNIRFHSGFTQQLEIHQPVKCMKHKRLQVLH